MDEAMDEAMDQAGIAHWELVAREQIRDLVARYNANGDLIASNPGDLHLYNQSISKFTAVDENGNLINGVGDSPNRHDMLTGSMADGMAFFPDADDHTCNNWTSSDEGSAMLGHHDRHGGGNVSWNAAHASRSCSQADLRATGGDGLFYCFAAD